MLTKHGLLKCWILPFVYALLKFKIPRDGDDLMKFEVIQNSKCLYSTKTMERKRVTNVLDSALHLRTCEIRNSRDGDDLVKFKTRVISVLDSALYLCTSKM